MKKKAVSMLLAGVMVVSMLAGCGKGGSSEPEKTADGKTKLKALFVSHSATQDVEDMKWVQELEEEAGVEIEWEQIRQDWETVKSTRFASGDIPDLLFNATNAADYTKYTGNVYRSSGYKSSGNSRKRKNLQYSQDADRMAGN